MLLQMLLLDQLLQHCNMQLCRSCDALCRPHVLVTSVCVRLQGVLALQASDGAILALTHNKAFADSLHATHVLRVR